MNHRAVMLVVALLVACRGGDAHRDPGPIKDGVRIAYSIDLDRAVEARATTAVKALREHLVASAIDGAVSAVPVPVGGLRVRLASAADRQPLATHVAASERGDIVEHACPPGESASSLCLRVSPEAADREKLTALKRAVDVLRGRLGRAGVPGRVNAEGDTIVVELPAASAEALHRTEELLARPDELPAPLRMETKTEIRDGVLIMPPE